MKGLSLNFNDDTITVVSPIENSDMLIGLEKIKQIEKLDIELEAGCGYLACKKKLAEISKLIEEITDIIDNGKINGEEESWIKLKNWRMKNE